MFSRSSKKRKITLSLFARVKETGTSQLTEMHKKEKTYSSFFFKDTLPSQWSHFTEPDWFEDCNGRACEIDHWLQSEFSHFSSDLLWNACTQILATLCEHKNFNWQLSFFTADPIFPSSLLNAELLECFLHQITRRCSGGRGRSAFFLVVRWLYEMF